MRKIGKPLILGIVAVLITGVVVYSAVRPQSVYVVQVEPKDAKLFFTEEGFVKDENTIDVYSLHAGAVVSLFVKENQHVNQGDPICVIDSAELEHELESAKNAIRGYLSQIDDLTLKERQQKDELATTRSKLQADYETIYAEESSASQSILSAEATKDEQLRLQNMIIEQNIIELQNAQDELQRYSLLFESGAVAYKELEAAQTAVNSLESLLSQNRQQLEIIRNSNESLSREAYFRSMKNSLQAQIAGIDNQLRSSYGEAMKDYYAVQAENANATVRLLEKQIEDCTVRAPAAGEITKLNIDKSNIAGTTTPVAVISTGFDNLVEVYVPTSEIGNVSINDIVELELKSDTSAIYHGVVIEIDERAVVKTSSLGIEKRKVKVTVQPLPEHADHFKPGYDLSASFTTYQASGKLTVPRTAVVTDAAGKSVWVLSGGNAELRAIEIEQELKTEYVIRSGLAAGDLIVRDASFAGLAEGKSFTAAY